MHEPVNPYAAGTVAAERWAATYGLAARFAAQYAEAWRNGNRGSVLDELTSSGTPAVQCLVLAMFADELDDAERGTLVRLLADRVIA